MNRRLSCLNLFGVLALAALCVLQWRHDRRLNLALDRSEQTRFAQAAALTEQTNKLNGLNEDLARFKTSLADEQQRRLQLEIKLRAADATNDLLAAECEQLKVSVTNWADAVTLRDQRIREANDRIEELSASLNDSIRKFNALVTNYNAVVSDLNALRSASATNTTAR
jgi:chromosome segregation ATPase